MTRTVDHANALEWLPAHAPTGPIVTSLPDYAEGFWTSFEEWEAWWRVAASACMAAIGPRVPVVFYQTDRRHDGVWLSKAASLHDTARAMGLQCVWHKIVLRRDVGAVDKRRPGYSHLVAFGRRVRPGSAWPDVHPSGPQVYVDGMPYRVTYDVVSWATRYGSPIVDPFCGRGTVLAAANALNVPAIGCDIDADQCAAARTLELPARSTWP